MRPAILFLDTNILLDCPRLMDYRPIGRPLTLVVIPEVMRELRGLAQSSGRGQAGPALQALAGLEVLARRRGSAAGVSGGRAGVLFRILPGEPGSDVATDYQLVLRAKAEQARQRGAIVAVVTRDWGVAELARTERVRSILIRGSFSSTQLERGIAEHDTMLDMEL